MRELLAATVTVCLCVACGGQDEQPDADATDDATADETTSGDADESQGMATDDSNVSMPQDEGSGAQMSGGDSQQAGDEGVASEPGTADDGAGNEDAANGGQSDDGAMPPETSAGDTNDVDPPAMMDQTDDGAASDDGLPADDSMPDDMPAMMEMGGDPPATDDSASAAPSDGCSANATPASGELSLDVDGTERNYIVSLPDDYDPTQPYPVIFAFHGLGGSASLVSGRFYFGLEVPDGKPSIFIYPDGLEGEMGTGWPNTDGQDVAFFDVLVESVRANYCVDNERLFSTGHSYGGVMTHTLGCERADVLRAIAPVAGAGFGRNCGGAIAAWGAHGDPDDTVAYDSGWSAISRVMETNGCDPDSATPVEPTANCSQYDCDDGYPVVWCVHDENHNWPEFASESIRRFFDSF